ncbi:uncharacterized protein LOC131236836 [Magnolia sinica]|uniref:uncharacterized protein LOC131236836 n=1 Tax=Magnolia sinica TaxID=86752 RepID=UPI00265A274D|nr:uncharacterized protein LOC131236836 [Magnolia sinica]
MENTNHGLPPLKRFKLLQQTTSAAAATSFLPAKKRIESRGPPTAYCLPAKKRVWALQPDFPPLDTIEEDPPFPEKKPIKGGPNLNALDGDFNGKSINGEEYEVTKDTYFEEEADEEDGIICSVCHSTDGDPKDPIVFCDGCDLMVHASCYGNPLIQAVPEGDWFCSRCEFLKGGAKGEDDDLDCCLCLLKGGATKLTVDGRWAHIMCALLVPEVFFRDSEGREGIDCSCVPTRRWEGVCYICDSKRGCVIECSEPKCSSAFHVSCGLNEELCIEYREGRTGAIIAGFCEIHTQLWKKQQQTGKFKIVPREGNMKA